MLRVAVFLDCQNVSLGARDTFFPVGSSASVGAVDPYRLGQLLAGRIAPAAALESVHVYRGIPDSKRDPKGYGAASRQRAAHEAAGYGIVAYHMRPLRYPQGWPRVKAQEKGMDVELAVDYVSMAARGDYDTAVLFSGGLRPAAGARGGARAAQAGARLSALRGRRVAQPGAQCLLAAFGDPGRCGVVPLAQRRRLSGRGGPQQLRGVLMMSRPRRASTA